VHTVRHLCVACGGVAAAGTKPLLPAQQGQAGHAAAVPVLHAGHLAGACPHSRYPVWAARLAPPPNTPHALRDVLKEGWWPMAGCCPTIDNLSGPGLWSYGCVVGGWRLHTPA
jgi:hypothetical protein